MFTSSILHGKSPRAKYSFDIIFPRLRYKFPCTVVRLRFLPHQVFHTTQVYSSDNGQQSKYFSCGFFWFIKYACVICTTVFVFRVKSMCVRVCSQEREQNGESVSVCKCVFRGLGWPLTVRLCACFVSVLAWLQPVYWCTIWSECPSVLCLCFGLCLCIFHCGVPVECCRCCGSALPLLVPLMRQCCVLWLFPVCIFSCHVLCLCFVWFYLFKQSGISLPKVLLHISSRWSWIHCHLMEKRSSKCNTAAGKLVPDDSCPWWFPLKS